jgi:hypothetical protein
MPKEAGNSMEIPEDRLYAYAKLTLGNVNVVNL